MNPRYLYKNADDKNRRQFQTMRRHKEFNSRDNNIKNNIIMEDDVCCYPHLIFMKLKKSKYSFNLPFETHQTRKLCTYVF